MSHDQNIDRYIKHKLNLRQTAWFAIILSTISICFYALDPFNIYTSNIGSSSKTNARRTVSNTEKITKLVAPRERKIKAHTFVPWNKEFPCFKNPSDDDGPAKGFFFRKLHKAASSTLSGIAVRISERKKPTTNEMSGVAKCYVQAHHEKQIDARYLGSRDRTCSFLWTFLRHPKRRVISHYFFFHVAMRDEIPNGANMMKYFKKTKNFMSHYIRTKDESAYNNSASAADETAASIIREYDFVGLTERFDESLVALRLLLGLDAEDILYLSSAKQNGSYVVESHTQKCKYVMSSFTTPEAEAYLNTEWKRDNDLDYALYAAAERSLDATIDGVIGRDRFDDALEEHLRLLDRAKEKCEMFARYPCSEEGERQESNCYWNDIGCGHKCLDNL